MKNQKTYDCVAEVRKIRDAMALKYYGNTELFLKDLDAAGERFNAEQKLYEEKRLEREQENFNSQNKDEETQAEDYVLSRILSDQFDN